MFSDATSHQHCASDWRTPLQVHFSASVTNVSIPAQAGDVLVATVTTGGATARAGSATTATPSISHVSCRLLVGADGANSAVQRSMQAAQPGQGWERKMWECHTGTQCWKVRARRSTCSFDESPWLCSVRRNIRKIPRFQRPSVHSFATVCTQRWRRTRSATMTDLRCLRACCQCCACYTSSSAVQNLSIPPDATLSPVLGSLPSDRWMVLKGADPTRVAAARSTLSSQLNPESPSRHSPPNAAPDIAPATSSGARAAASGPVSKGPMAHAPLSCAILPDSDPQLPRAGVFRGQPDLPIFQIRDPDELYAYLEAKFPQVRQHSSMFENELDERSCV